MDNIQQLVLDALRSGTMSGEEEYTWEARRTPDSFPCDQWVMSVSVAPYNPEVHVPWFMTWAEDDEDEMDEARARLQGLIEDEGTPTHMARVVFRTKWEEVLELVDGTELYLQIDEDAGTVKSIWEEIWNGNQPDYYGGPIDGAREWVNELPGTTGEFYLQLEYPWSE